MFRRSKSTKSTMLTGGEGMEGKEEVAPAAEQAKPMRKTPASPAAKSTKQKSTKQPQDEITERTERYDAFMKKLNALILALRKRRECMIQSRKADHEVFRLVAAWTSGTPLGPSTAGGKDPSYATINKSMDSSSRASEDRYEEKIIDYAVEWQKLVALKFSSEQEEVRLAKRDAEHYNKKVGSLHSSRHSTEARGNEMSPKFAEKVERNEEKLEKANKSFDKHKRNLIRLVDELVDQSWKDLYPLLAMMFEFDVKNAQDRAMVLADLHDVMKNLSIVAGKFGIHRQESPSATDLWRTLRSEWQSSVSERETSSRSAGREEKPPLSSAFEDVDIDLSQMTDCSPKEKLPPLVESAPFDLEKELESSNRKNHKDKTATGSSKGLAPLKSPPGISKADETSLTEAMMDEELLESSWASDELPRVFSCD